MRGMNDAVENQFIDLGNNADIARNQFADFCSFLTLKNHRVRNLDSFLVVAYEEQIITAHCALMNSEYADFADVRVVNDFEYMSNQWKFRIRN